MIKSIVLSVLLAVGFITQNLNLGEDPVTSKEPKVIATVDCNCPATTPHSYNPFPPRAWIGVTTDPLATKHISGSCDPITCDENDSPLCESQTVFNVTVTLGPGESLIPQHYLPPFGWIPDPAIVGPIVHTFNYGLYTARCGTKAERIMLYTKNNGDFQVITMKAICGACK